MCYALGITAVNPGTQEMLFERFLSKERNEPPDIDVDFEHQRREEVIQYIYARSGRELAALAATVICYRLRSAPRDTGRQRPGTASGTTFVTLEDETGSVNVIVWSHVDERQRGELLGARLMGVEGWLERESGVMHLIATRLSDHTPLLGRLGHVPGIFTESAHLWPRHAGRTGNGTELARLIVYRNARDALLGCTRHAYGDATTDCQAA